MRYAILSDIHANLQAWHAVFTDICEQGVDQTICLGDVVGYGPSPAPVLKQVYAHVHHFVLGNHDAVVAGRLSPSCFNDRAKQLISWTSEQLDARASRFLAQLPYVLEGETFRCVHGNPASPAQFTYVLEPSHATAAWQSCTEQLIFIGHSHVPGFYVLGNSGTPHWLDPQDFATEEHKRYIVNVGSVGQPRRDDVRASYCLLDEDQGEVFFRQVPFDLVAYRSALEESTIPNKETHFLKVADKHEPPPLREMLDFSPLREDQVAHIDIGVASLQKAVRSARRWRLGTLFLAVLLATAVAGGTYIYKNRAPAYTEFSAARQSAIAESRVGQVCLPPLPAQPGIVTADNPLQDWTVRVMQPAEQSVAVVLPPEDSATNGKEVQPFLRFSSAVLEEVMLVSRPVAATITTRFQLMASCKAETPLVGHLEICLLQACSDGTERMVLHYPLENIPEERWKAIRKSLKPKGLRADGAVRWVFRGQFTGSVLLRGCNLKRTEKRRGR